MSPISNSWLNQGVAAILSGIQDLELNTSGGGGSARYRYAKSARRMLIADEMQRLIPSTSDAVDREVSIRLVSGESVSLKRLVIWEKLLLQQEEV
ncbi:MAG: hypothetical protein QNJ68_03530 [Microcoleaceae cyanobacterium MO_207.B10]|nr:hypothetical protein [Microcoleaceae cyanobacterium MO_207.B10]